MASKLTLLPNKVHLYALCLGLQFLIVEGSHKKCVYFGVAGKQCQCKCPGLITLLLPLFHCLCMY